MFSRRAHPVSWIALLVALGLGLRAAHYLRNPAVWHDEGMLIYNLLHRDYAGLIGALDYFQSAPVLFLWLEKAVVGLLGDSTFALRLVPFLASCAALLLFVPLARRVLGAWGAGWAVVLFACSDKLLWHACETKPYATDVLAAVVLCLLFCTTQAWRLERRLLLFTAVAPVVLFLAYPGCFLCGGLLLALLPAVWRNRRLPVFVGYGLLALAVFASFAVLMTGPIRAQRYEETVHYWRGIHHYPPWDRPWTVPLWIVVHTVEVFRYCCDPIGLAIAPLAVFGGIRLWKRGQAALVMLLAVPFALALVASLIGAYPYGGSRLLVYTAPAVLLTAAEGIPPVLGWLFARWRPAWVLAALVLLYPVEQAGCRVIWPWRRADTAGATGYVLSRRGDGERVLARAPEHGYYFRQLKGEYIPFQGDTQPVGRRVWVLLSEERPDDWRWVKELLATGQWRVVEQREFTATTVLLLDRKHLTSAVSPSDARTRTARPLRGWRPLRRAASASTSHRS